MVLPIEIAYNSAQRYYVSGHEAFVDSLAILGVLSVSFAVAAIIGSLSIFNRQSERRVMVWGRVGQAGFGILCIVMGFWFAKNEEKTGIWCWIILISLLFLIGLLQALVQRKKGTTGKS